MLKIKLLLTSFIFFAGIAHVQAFSIADSTESSAISWLSFEEAVKLQQADKAAGRAPKKIFIDVYTDWCGWCKKMDKETFQQPEIAAYLTQKFYPVKLDAEQKEAIIFDGHTFEFKPGGRRGYHEFAAALLDGKLSYPTVVFMNEEAQLMQRVPGYLDVPTFDAILHYLAEEHFKTTPWPQFQQQFNQQKSNK